MSVAGVGSAAGRIGSDTDSVTGITLFGALPRPAWLGAGFQNTGLQFRAVAPTRQKYSFHVDVHLSISGHHR